MDDPLRSHGWYVPPTVRDMARLRLPTRERLSMETYSSMSMIMLVKKVQCERPLRNRIACLVQGKAVYH